MALFDVGGVRVEVLAEHGVVRCWPRRGADEDDAVFDA
jgi:hypothetical protein